MLRTAARMNDAHRIKLMIVAIVTAVFVSSVVFAYIMITYDNEAATNTAAVIFAALMISLNALLLFTVLRESKRARRAAFMKKCASCGAVISRTATECPGCRAVQVNDDTYLDPKREDTAGPKKKR
jgi:cytochrome bd-type quinol oxidase subunit 2